VLRAEKILDAVRDILGDVAIEDLPIPYTSVSTDLITGRSVWLQRGSVVEAIRASIAIPGVISPHVLDGRLLADGGILDPLPMAPLAAVRADVTIAVSLNGDDPRRDEPPHPEPGQRSSAEILSRMWRSTTALLDTASARTLLDTPAARSVMSRFSTSDTEFDTLDGALAEADIEAAADVVIEADPLPIPRLGGFEVMNRTIDIAQAALMRHTLAAYPPDLLIEVPRTACRSLEYYRATEVIDIGQELAALALDTFIDRDADTATSSEA